ncbi:MAG: GIY-YIG nuclease family protein [Verrucomicrobia bacterium]|nr:GIY-YIG nuclease family protein [Verrucomicrobiota bacterium]
MSAWVYVLRCRDGSLYTGWTNHLERRLQAHRNGTGGKYTRSRLPVRLAAVWKHRSYKEARSAEANFKQLTRAEKLVRIRGVKKKSLSARVRPRTEKQSGA